MEELGDAEEPRATSGRQQDYPEVVGLGGPVSDMVELGDTRPKVVERGVAVSEVELSVTLSDEVELGDAKPEVVELDVAVSEVLGLGGAEPEVVKLGVTVSELVWLGYAEPEVVDLGVAVSEVRTQDEGEPGKDGAARFVYTPSSSSNSERVDVESAVTRSSQQASSGQKGTSTYPFDRARLIWARLAPGGWDDGPGAVWGDGGGRGGEEHEGAGTRSSGSTREQIFPFDPGKQVEGRGTSSSSSSSG